MGYLFGAIALLMLCGVVVYRKGGNMVALLLMNALLMGMAYCRLRPASDKPLPVTSSLVLHGREVYAQSGLSQPHRAVLEAMLLGDRSELTYEQKQLFRQAGAQHVLALSGMHLGILLALLSFLFLPFVRFSRWRWPSLFFVLLLLWSYTYMVGMPKSLLRASLMTSLFLVGRFSLRPTRGYELLGTVVLLMLLADPQCAFDIGAQLSVAAMVGLTCFYPVFARVLASSEPIAQYAHMPRKGNKLANLFRFCTVSLSAWMFTMPLVLYYFKQFQPWQPLASVVLIPITTLVLYGGVLLYVVVVCGWGVLSAYLVVGLDGLMQVQDVWLACCAALPMSNVSVHHVSLWHVALLYLFYAILWMLLRYRTPKILALSCLVGVVILLSFVLL